MRTAIIYGTAVTKQLLGFEIRTLVIIALLPDIPSKANKITDNVYFITSR